MVQCRVRTVTWSRGDTVLPRSALQVCNVGSALHGQHRTCTPRFTGIIIIFVGSLRIAFKTYLREESTCKSAEYFDWWDTIHEGAYKVEATGRDGREIEDSGNASLVCICPYLRNFDRRGISLRVVVSNIALETRESRRLQTNLARH